MTLNYKYIPSPKLGDLIGYATTRAIVPGVIMGFSKGGNIQFIRLEKYSIDRYKTGKQLGKHWSNPVKSIPKNYLERAILIDAACLTKEETDLYNYLIKNTPLP